MNKQFCPYCMSPVAPGESCPVCGLTEGNYTAAPHHLPPGTILAGRYLMGRVLGEGGFGITYIGCDLRLELKVAIKEYFPTDRASRNCASSLDVISFTGQAGRGYESGKEKFLFEARTMARMDKQPQIVSVRDFFEYHNTAYIVMEYVEGTNLKDVVSQRGGRIPAQELLETVKPLFSAMQSMHDLGLIHRDISPDNLMLENGMIRLLDFGCARESADGAETMTIALKQGYAPIEQYQQKGQGPWTDVYALAATLYFCMTGKVPPRAVDRIYDDGLILPRKLGVDLTDSQEKALLKALTVRPRSRFQSAQEFAAALYAQSSESAIQEEPGQKKEPLPTEHVFPQTYQEIPEKQPEPPVERVEEAKTEPREPKKTPAPKPIEKAPAPAPREKAPKPKVQPKAEEKPAAKKPEETPRRRRKSVPLWKKYLPYGAGAAAVLALVLILVAVFGGGDAPEKTEPVSDPVQTQAQEPMTAEEIQDAFASAYEVTGPSEQDFTALLKNDEIQAIRIKSGVNLNLKDAPVEINKPLLVEEGAELGSLQHVTLGPGGYLEIQGRLWQEGFLQLKGGSLRVAQSGEVYGSGHILARRESDIVNDGGFWGEDDYFLKEHVQYFDEEAVFAEAIHVTSWDQLRVSQGSFRAKAVVVDADIEIEHAFNQTIPTMIAPGVKVTMCDQGVWNFDDTNQWNVDGTWLVNYGTIDGYMQMGAWSGKENTFAAYLNYGHMEGTYFIQPDFENAPKYGWFVNQGTMVIDSAGISCDAIINTGTMEYKAIDPQFSWLDIINCRLFNSGLFQASSQTQSDGWMNIGGEGGQFFNVGQVELGRNSSFTLQSHMWNWGSLRLTDASAKLTNIGYIESDGEFTAVNGAGIYNHTLIAYHPGSTFQVPGLRGRGNTLAFTWGDWNSPEIPGGCWVSTEAELQAALKDSSAEVIEVTQDITLTGDLVIHNKIVVLPGKKILTQGHTITVKGKNGGMHACAIDFKRGELIVQDGASAVITEPVTDLSTLRVRDRGQVVVNCWIDLKNTAVEVQNGGTLTLVRGGNMAYSDVRVAEGGVFWLLSDLWLQETKLTVEQNGEFNSEWANLTLEEGCRLDNYGMFIFRSGHRHHWFHANGEVTNYQTGVMELGGFTEFNSPSENYGTIQIAEMVYVNEVFNNMGSIQIHNDEADFKVQNAGKLWGTGTVQRGRW